MALGSQNVRLQRAPLQMNHILENYKRILINDVCILNLGALEPKCSQATRRMEFHTPGQACA